MDVVRFRNSVLAAICALASLNIAGCSIYMAAKQPSKKNLDVLNEGTPRSVVLAELGQPLASDTKDGKKVDVFKFTQGYSQGTKASRAMFHTAADVLTIGMWEVVGTPTEAIFNGDPMAYEVTYNADEKVEKVVTLQK